MKTKIVFAAAITSVLLFACTAHIDSGTATVPDPTIGQKIPVTPSSCPNFAGNYNLVHMATLAVKQVNCSQIVFDQRCDSAFCDSMGIKSAYVSIPLDGTTAVVTEGSSTVQYQAKFSDQTLVVIRTNGSDVQTRNLVLSDHPCDPANPNAGIEMKVSETQGSATVTSCQPWTK